ncbi:Hypothetical predicted protein, partial [Lynx pardinus]
WSRSPHSWSRSPHSWSHSLQNSHSSPCFWWVLGGVGQRCRCRGEVFRSPHLNASPPHRVSDRLRPKATRTKGCCVPICCWCNIRGSCHQAQVACV